MPKKILTLLVIIISYYSVQAQYGRTYQEIGIMAGPVFFQSDFGARGEIENAIKNVGISGGVFYYLSLNNDRSTFSDNFKIRLEASFMKVQLQHYGKYVEASTDFARKLRGMNTTLSAGNVGFQLEYYPFKTDDYSGATFSPYISAGGQLTSYNAKAYSKLGPIGTPQVVPVKYVDGFKNSSGWATSVTASMGFRYKLNDYNAIIVDGRLQYYFTDWMDGMNPDRRTYTENKTNDYSATLNIGYVYYFN
ncbi:THC0290_0291 family protein [Flavobacterium soli]|uniref:THC0290_0291 family protein n=1 Tax=Flavobacterium soli TaxID=344881 RepID=UPI000687ED47|nr:DUF6089 family protein [Flavobacterium soli]